MSITKMRNSFSHILKPILILIALVFFVGAFLVFGGSPMAGNKGGKSLKDTIAVVNGREIPRSDFESIFANMMKQSDRYGTTATQIAGMKSQILNDLINRNIMISAAEAQGISVGWMEQRREREKMVNDQVEQARKSLGQGRKKPLTDKEFSLMLSKLSPPMTMDSMRSDVENQLTPDVVRQQLMIQKLDAKVKAGVGNIDDNRLRENYQQLRVRQIVISSKGMPEAQTKERADKVLKEIQAGGDFAALAAKYSDDAATKARGGDRGYEKPSEDPDLKGLKVGQTSGVITSSVYPQSFRIVKIESSKLDLPADFDKNKAKYRAEVKTQLENQASQDMFQKIQKEAKVEVKDNELKGYWLAGQAQTAATPAEKSRLVQQAIEALLKATADDSGRADPYTQLAQLYVLQDKPDKAIGVLVDILDKRKLTEGADLRLQLAQLYVQTKQPELAKPQADIARDMAYNQPMVHYQLSNLYGQMGAKEDAAKEAAWLKDYLEKSKAAQAAQNPSQLKPVRRP